MTENGFITWMSGHAEVAGASRSRLLRLPMRSLFPTTLQNPELLPAAPADCPTSRGLTKSEEDETIIINRPGRSTYPGEKSVLTSGATPASARPSALCLPAGIPRAKGIGDEGIAHVFLPTLGLARNRRRLSSKLIGEAKSMPGLAVVGRPVSAPHTMHGRPRSARRGHKVPAFPGPRYEALNQRQ